MSLFKLELFEGARKFIQTFVQCCSDLFEALALFVDHIQSIDLIFECSLIRYPKPIADFVENA
jgi:hypothetical protein